MHFDARSSWLNSFCIWKIPIKTKMLITVVFIFFYSQATLSYTDLYIRDCKLDARVHTFSIEEGTTLTLCCKPFYRRSQPYDFTWDFNLGANRTVRQITCRCYTQSSACQGNCTAVPEASATQNGSTSVITIPKVDRNMFNSSSMYCSASGYDRIGAEISVIYTAQVERCEQSINSGNWSVSGFCKVSRAFSSLKQYNVVIYNNGQQLSIKQYNTLSAVNNLSTGLDYVGGTYYFSFSLDNSYIRTAGTKNFSLHVLPAMSGQIANYIFSHSTVEPGEVALTTECLKLPPFVEGYASSRSCVCRCQPLGQPAGRLIWLLGEAEIPFHYGEMYTNFPHRQLNRTHHRRLVTCKLDWIRPKTANQSFTVDYFFGPDSVAIVPKAPLSFGVSDSTTLPCVAHNTNAMHMLTFTWGGACAGRQGDTCTLTSPMHVLTGQRVTCSVFNRLSSSTKSVDWTIPTNAAVGPDSVAIVPKTPLSLGASGSTTLLCVAHTNAMQMLTFTWGGACAGRQGDTCTLTSPLRGLAGQSVTCRVFNRLTSITTSVDWTIPKNAADNTATVVIKPQQPINFTTGSNNALLCFANNPTTQSRLSLNWGGFCSGRFGDRCRLTSALCELVGRQASCWASDRSIQIGNTAYWSMPDDEACHTITTVDVVSKDQLTRVTSFLTSSLGAALAVVGLAILVLVVMVVMLARQIGFQPCACSTCFESIYDSPSLPRNQNEGTEMTYTSLSAYRQPVVVSRESSLPATVTATRKTSETQPEPEATYENMAAVTVKSK